MRKSPSKRASFTIGVALGMICLSGCGRASPADRLQEGARTCDLTEVKAALDAKADVNDRDKDSQETALMAAAYGGCIEVTRLLISRGAEVNAVTRDEKNPDENGTSALILSSFEDGKPEIVEALIKAGANINAKAQDGTNALQIAVRYGKIDSVKALVEAGADVNAKGAFDESSLEEAMSGEKSTNSNFGSPKVEAEIAEYLRQHGAKTPT